MTFGCLVRQRMLEAQIQQISSRIEELRLEEVPDVESIRNLQSNLDGLRKAYREEFALEASREQVEL